MKINMRWAPCLLLLSAAIGCESATDKNLDAVGETPDVFDAGEPDVAAAETQFPVDVTSEPTEYDAAQSAEDMGTPRYEMAEDAADEMAEDAADEMAEDAADEMAKDAADEVPVLPNLPMGPSDKLSKSACSLVEGPTTSVIATSQPSEAGQVLLTPSVDNAYLVTLPESGLGYVTLEVPEWAITIGGSLSYSHTLEVLDPDFVTEEMLPLSWNGACSDLGLTDQRRKYHSWGSFTVKLSGAPNDVVHLSFIKYE